MVSFVSTLILELARRAVRIVANDVLSVLVLVSILIGACLHVVMYLRPLCGRLEMRVRRI